MALSANPTLVEIVNELERLNNLIVDRGGSRTITPGTGNQILSKGNYKGDITVLGDSDLVSSNIRNGINLFGVVGNLLSLNQSSGTVGYNNGGIFTDDIGQQISGLTYIEIQNLGYTPKFIGCTAYSGGSFYYSILILNDAQLNSPAVYMGGKNSTRRYYANDKVFLTNGNIRLPINSSIAHNFTAIG